MKLMSMKGKVWRCGKTKVPSVRDKEKYICCYCCHVRTGTVCLGVWHLMFQLLTLCCVAVSILHPELINGAVWGAHPSAGSGDTSENSTGGAPLAAWVRVAVATLQPLLTSDGGVDMRGIPTGAPPLTILAATATAGANTTATSPTRQDYDVALLDFLRDYNTYLTRHFVDKTVSVELELVVIALTLTVTTLLLYGAYQRRPHYLLPFITLQILDIIMCAVTLLGFLIVYFAMDKERKFNVHLVRMCFVFGFLIVYIKGWLIDVVCSCYEYLGGDIHEKLEAHCSSRCRRCRRSADEPPVTAAAVANGEKEIMLSPTAV